MPHGPRHRDLLHYHDAAASGGEATAAVRPTHAVAWSLVRSAERFESLVGILQHASSDFRPGRLFLRRMYDLLARTSGFKPHYFVHLNANSKAAIEWWCMFLRTWNAVSMLRPLRRAELDVVLHSDDSEGWECGAYWQTLRFQAQWYGTPTAGESTAAKELLPIVLAALLWGRVW